MRRRGSVGAAVAQASPETIDSFAARLVLAMKALNLSRGQLAAAVGVDKSLVSRWASGQVVPTDYNLARISDALTRVKPGFNMTLWDRPRTEFASFFGAASPTAGNIILAVLAFDNLSGESDMTFFSEGLSEEILYTVARAAGLQVIGRGSSLQFRGAEKAAKRIAKTLNATHVLDGSVRRSGNTVRIIANLIHCGSETTVWSQRFEHQLSDVFALQDNIAAAVARALKVVVLPTPQREPIDPAAYDLYLRALEIRNRGLDANGHLTVVRLLKRATELAPRFARAWEFLATMQATYLRFVEQQEPVFVARSDVAKAANTAIKLDPGLGGSYQALGYLEPLASFAERELLHEKALSVSSNDPTVLTNASFLLGEVGRIREALSLSEQAYLLDPASPWTANWYASLLDYAGRAEEGLASLKTFCSRWPDNDLIAWNAVAGATFRSDWRWFDELVVSVRKKNLDGSMLREFIAYGEALREPRPDVKEAALRSAKEALGRHGTLPARTFRFLHQLGLVDETFELIEECSFAYMFDPEQRSPNGTVGETIIFSAISNAAMMRDIRFVALCAKLGLCDYWVKTGRWPDCAEAVASYYDFKAEARRLAGVNHRPRPAQSARGH
jgi:TolB-like protein